MMRILIVICLLSLFFNNAVAIEPDAESSEAGSAATQSTAQTSDEPVILYECSQDDPRLSTMGLLFQQVEEGTSGTISVTPKTYSEMYPSVKERLGDNLLICPSIPVIEGKPVQRIPISWKDLDHLIYLAAVQQNEKRLQELISGFVVEQQPAEDLLLLAQPYRIDPSLTSFLSENLGVQISQANSDQRQDYQLPYMMKLDIYRAFGGRAEGGLICVIPKKSIKNENDVRELIDFGGKIIEPFSLPDSNRYMVVEQMTRSLAAVGITVFNELAPAISTLKK